MAAAVGSRLAKSITWYTNRITEQNAGSAQTPTPNTTPALETTAKKMSDRPYKRRTLLKIGASGAFLGNISTAAAADPPATSRAHEQLADVSLPATVIEDWHDLAAIREDLTGEYILANPLDETTSGYEEHIQEPEGGWEPIGNADTAFAGTFDGGTNDIADIRINRPDDDYIGVFGRLTGTITQFGVRDSSVTGNDQTALLAGENRGTITQAFSHGTVRGGTTVGGLVGQNSQGSINDTYAIASVAGEDVVGGLVGANEDASVGASYAAGEVTQLE